MIEYLQLAFEWRCWIEALLARLTVSERLHTTSVYFVYCNTHHMFNTHYCVYCVYCNNHHKCNTHHCVYCVYCNTHHMCILSSYPTAETDACLTRIFKCSLPRAISISRNESFRLIKSEIVKLCFKGNLWEKQWASWLFLENNGSYPTGNQQCLDFVEKFEIYVTAKLVSG